VKEGVCAHRPDVASACETQVCLAAHGLALGDVVKLTVYLTDQAQILENVRGAPCRVR
jgi:hypothetical protein